MRLTRDSSAKKIDFGLQFMTDVIKHGRRMIRLRSNLIHFPGILVEFDAESCGDSLSFFDELMQEMPEIAELFLFCKVITVLQFGQC